MIKYPRVTYICSNNILKEHSLPDSKMNPGYLDFRESMLSLHNPHYSRTRTGCYIYIYIYIGRWFLGCPAYQSGPGKDGFRIDVSMASQSSSSTAYFTTAKTYVGTYI